MSILKPKTDLFNGHTKQKEIYDTNVRFKVLVCGRGFGKSRLQIYEALKTCLKTPKSLAWLVCPTLNSVEEIYFDDIVDTIILLGFYDTTTINKRNNSFYFANGSSLFLKSSDRPERLRGRRCDYVGLDEFAYFTNQSNFKKIFLPILKPTGRMLITSTPNGYDELHKLFMMGKDKDYPEWCSWQYASEDNPTVDWKDQLEDDRKTMSASEYRQERLGMFESMTSRVSVDFNRKYNTCHLPLFKDKHIRLSCDFNVNPMSWCLFQIVPKDIITNNVIDLHQNIKLQDEVVCVFKEFKESDCNTKDMIKILKQYLSEIDYKGDITFYGDASGLQRNTNSDYTDWLLLEMAFPQAYFNYDTSNPYVSDRINTANMKIKNMDNEIGLLLDIDNTEETIRDFEQVSYKQGTKQIDKSKEKYGIGHLYDAITYGIYKEFNLLDEYENNYEPFDIDIQKFLV